MRIVEGESTLVLLVALHPEGVDRNTYGII